MSTLRTFRNSWSYSALSAVKRLEYLRSFLRFCVDSDWLEQNAAQVLLARRAGLRPRIPRRDLTQAQAAHLFGVSQPRVSDIVRGRVTRFTIDALVEMLARAGVRPDIVQLQATA